MSAHYAVLPRADRDLDEQADHLAAEAGLRTALRFLEAAHETFSLIASQPAMGWPCRMRYAGLASVRVFPVRTFDKMLVFYRPVASNRIEIVRVLHGSRDLQAVFRNEGHEPS